MRPSYGFNSKNAEIRKKVETISVKYSNIHYLAASHNGWQSYRYTVKAVQIEKQIEKEVEACWVYRKAFHIKTLYNIPELEMGIYYNGP